nr:hypothetical protein [Candidatus Sigynarchaeota archaeon]
MADQNPFGGYQPKRTPDTIHDYLPFSGKKPDDVLGKIPEAKLDNLKKILDLLPKFQKEAIAHPGALEDGRVMLGANPKQYVPSEAELIVSELGRAIEAIVKATPADNLNAYLAASKIKAREIAFVPIVYRHVDVMGSGRFVYADKGKEIKIKL